jgi:cyanophycin synthetase
MSSEAAAPVEVRLLTGPNLYFPRPAVKLTLDASAALAADPATFSDWQRATGAGGAAGLPGSPARAEAAAALAAAVARRAGAAIRTRLPVVGRVGDDNTVVVAFPYRHRGTADAFARAAAVAFGQIVTGTVAPRAAVAAVRTVMAGVDPGETVRAIRPRIPVIAVTGTNGKTTTTRLISHLLATDGQVPGWSSTDGIVIAGEVVETGDWSGPGGAGRVLSDPRVTVAVTETARGGILLRGVGTAVNDVSVITNISADHLGLLGVHTLAQLAEVKSVVARITKPTGWTVLNADDPLVRDMRLVSRAKPWFFSPDPENPYLPEALDAGGRAITVQDGVIVVLALGLDPRPVVPVTEVPLTMAGASRVNLENVLAATAAALAAGVSEQAVAEGLRSFLPDAAHNSGRLNCYLLDGTVVVLDLAHNEASLNSLLDVADALRLPGGELAVVAATAGDRNDEAIHAMGVMVGSRADRMVVAGMHKYLRGRAVEEMDDVWSGGAAESGMVDVGRAGTELAALTLLLDAGLPQGSVIAVCTLEDRDEMAAEVLVRGGHAMSPAEIAVRVAPAGA